jgi:hypothetical protein
VTCGLLLHNAGAVDYLRFSSVDHTQSTGKSQGFPTSDPQAEYGTVTA